MEKKSCYMSSNLNIVLVQNCDQLEAAVQLRKAYLKDIYKEENFTTNELNRDKMGKVFLFFYENKVVATVRLVPVGHGLTMSERIGGKSYRPSKSHRIWEIGRLVIHPNYRGLPLLKDCLSRVASWLKQNTQVTVVLAACKTRFINLYQRFGFYVINQDDDRLVTASNDATYSLIQARLPQVIKKLA